MLSLTVRASYSNPQAGKLPLCSFPGHIEIATGRSRPSFDRLDRDACRLSVISPVTGAINGFYPVQ